MADNKKYYYLKLKDNFFDSDEIVILESMKDGYIYSNILLKLYLRSLKNEGRLMFNESIPYNSTMIANLTRHSVGDVEKAVKTLSDLGLIEILDNGAIYMMDIQNFIGESSTEADRKRAYRKSIENEKNALISVKSDGKGQMSDKCTPELEIEIELEKELEIEKELSFMSFWNEYPKKVGKAQAEKTFKKKVKDEPTLNAILLDLRKRKNYEQWTKDKGKYIPNPSTYLNQERWLDEYDISPTGSTIQDKWGQYYQKYKEEEEYD